MQIDVLPLFGQRRQIEEQQSHREKLPLAALADEADAHRAGFLARLADFDGDKGEILSHVGCAEVHVGDQSGGFAAHFGAAFGGGGEQRPARIVEQDEAFQQSRLLRFGQGAKCGSVSCGEMSGEGRVILAAGGRECIGEGGDRIVRGRRGNLSVQLGEARSLAPVRGRWPGATGPRARYERGEGQDFARRRISARSAVNFERGSTCSQPAARAFAAKSVCT